MKKINYFILLILVILFFSCLYLIHELNSIEVDPMSDGQAGIGIGIIAMMIMGIGFLEIIVSSIIGIILLVNKKFRVFLSYFNLIFSLCTISYIYFKIFN